MNIIFFIFLYMLYVVIIVGIFVLLYYKTFKLLKKWFGVRKKWQKNKKCIEEKE